MDRPLPPGPMQPAIPGAVGHFTICVGWSKPCTLSFFGGPYDCCPGPNFAFGVCVRSEELQVLQMDAHLPIEDYGIPHDDIATTRVLISTLEAAIGGRRVYVGCKGGLGRTGLFLALAAKSLGVIHPIEFIRSRYAASVIETPEQEIYVSDFDVCDVVSALFGKS